MVTIEQCYFKDGEWHAFAPAAAGANALTVIDGKVCTSTDVVGVLPEWKQLEAASKIDAPYLNEWGWKCAVKDGTTELYKWLYRCMKEGFRVPYRTIVVGGVEHRFETELTERNKEWLDLATQNGRTPFDDIALEGGDRSEATAFCIPLVQFGHMEDQALLHGITRVAFDNPSFCFPAASADCIIRDDNGTAMYYWSIYRTEKAAEKNAAMIKQAKASIDKYVQMRAADPSPEMQKHNKKRTAEIIHDYIVMHGNRYTDLQGGAYTPRYLQPTMIAAIDPSRRAVCDGYTQAFNYFARSYGINSIAMTAKMYDKDGVDHGGHIWNVVNFGEYGDYSDDPAAWSPIDVFWDDTDGGIRWDYFGNPTNIFDPDGEYVRMIEKSTSYGAYPFDNADGSTPEPSLSILGLNENGDYDWEV